MLICMSEINKAVNIPLKNCLNDDSSKLSGLSQGTCIGPVMAVDLFWQLDARSKLLRSHVSQKVAHAVREWPGSCQ